MRCSIYKYGSHGSNYDSEYNLAALHDIYVCIDPYIMDCFDD